MAAAGAWPAGECNWLGNSRRFEARVDMSFAWSLPGASLSNQMIQTGEDIMQETSAAGPTASAASVTTSPNKHTATTAVGNLLQALTSHDNQSRNSAEQNFHALKETHPEALVFGLLEASEAVFANTCPVISSSLTILASR